MSNKSAGEQSTFDMLDWFQSQGRCSFTLVEAQSKLPDRTELGIKKALHRLELKGKIIIPKRHFYVIVPPEYRTSGGPPATWYIRQLMEYEQRPYYLGLLSAASFHGATHQAVFQLQVMTNYPLRPIEAGQTSIKFFTKSYLEKSLIEKIKTPSGYVNISTPEVTALDLMKYYYASGHLNHVATVLTEMQEKFVPKKFSEMLQIETGVAHVQRLAAMLEIVNADESILNILSDWLKKQKTQPVLLNPEVKNSDERVYKNKRWQVMINEKIEADL